VEILTKTVRSGFADIGRDFSGVRDAVPLFVLTGRDVRKRFPTSETVFRFLALVFRISGKSFLLWGTAFLTYAGPLPISAMPRLM
jgi:hypothetical protein